MWFPTCHTTSLVHIQAHGTCCWPAHRSKKSWQCKVSLCHIPQRKCHIPFPSLSAQNHHSNYLKLSLYSPCLKSNADLSNLLQQYKRCNPIAHPLQKGMFQCGVALIWYHILDWLCEYNIKVTTSKTKLIYYHFCLFSSVLCFYLLGGFYMYDYIYICTIHMIFICIYICIYYICIIYVLHMYYIYIICIIYICIICVIYVLYMCYICIIYVSYMYYICIIYVLYMYYIYMYYMCYICIIYVSYMYYL